MRIVNKYISLRKTYYYVRQIKYENTAYFVVYYSRYFTAYTFFFTVNKFLLHIIK